MVKFTDLNINNKTLDSNTFEFNGHTIKVATHIPVRDMYDLLMITLQKSKEDGIFNTLKMDVYFHLNLVYLYSDIEFSDEDRADEFELHDKLTQSGFMDKFLEAFDDDEYNYLKEQIEALSTVITNYNSTAAALISSLIQDLPAQAEAARKIVDDFNPEKYQEVIKFAEAANGGRPLDRKSMAAIAATEDDGK